MGYGKYDVIMNMTEKARITIWETPDRPVPLPKELVLLDEEATALSSLFARAVIDGAKGINIYQAAYDGHCGYTVFAWTDGDGKQKGQLLHNDKDYVLRAAERFLEELTSRYEHMYVAKR